MVEEAKSCKLGTQWVKFPSAELQPLEDCNHLLGDRQALLNELDEKGYLLVRGFHDRDEVLQARVATLKLMKDCRGRVCEPGCVHVLQGRNTITQSEAVAKILEGPRPYAFFKTLLGEEAKTFDYKWLRAVHRLAFTGAHVDNVYMARGTSNLYTMWTPFGDVNPEIGCLAMCEGSHRLPGFDRLHETYSQVDVETVNLNGTGWFTSDPFEITQKFGGQWKTTNFNAGDVLIFSMKTVHMSTANLTDLVRISCDTRWQRVSEPADPRYVGDLKPIAKFGLHHDKEKDPSTVTMEELREKWGLQ